MKKIMLSMLAIATLASCSKSEEGLNGSNPDAHVPIKLGSGVAVISRAPIVPTTNFDAGIAGWEHASGPDYTGAPLWNTKVSTTAVAPGGQAAAVTWTDQKFYNADETTNTYIKAWYPEGTLSTSTVTFTNTDGSVDAMLSPVINGNKNDATGKVLAFAHKTTQLTFTVQAGTGLATNAKITSIKIKGAQLPVGFNLGTDAVTFSNAADLTVPSISPTSITSSAASVGVPVMIKPITGKKIILDVTTDQATYLNKEVTVVTNDVEEGTHYVIALTFTQKEIGLTATVADWVTSSGSGSIE